MSDPWYYNGGIWLIAVFMVIAVVAAARKGRNGADESVGGERPGASPAARRISMRDAATQAREEAESLGLEGKVAREWRLRRAQELRGEGGTTP